MGVTVNRWLSTGFLRRLLAQQTKRGYLTYKFVRGGRGYWPSRTRHEI